MIVPHKKAVPEWHASQSRQGSKNKRKVGDNIRCVSVILSSFQNLSTIYVKSWRDQLNRGNLVTDKYFFNPVEFQATHTYCLVCWLFQFLEKLQRHKPVFVLNCQNILRLYFPVFQFRFRVRKNMVQTTCRFKPHCYSNSGLYLGSP